ncbi:unnamed protein product [Amoebophrya sp. A25]|nr:unnamed protein product [Amoebophrya sp. A25]|eukprot:GSA25T00012952001.1
MQASLSPKMKRAMQQGKDQSPQMKRMTSLWQRNMGKVCTSMRDWRKRNHCTQEKNVFIIVGGYPDMRRALLNRGWVENTDPTSRFFDFIFTLKAGDIDYDRLDANQTANHFQRNREITTKLGLTMNLKSNAAWLPPVGNTVYRTARTARLKDQEAAAKLQDQEDETGSGAKEKDDGDGGSTTASGSSSSGGSSGSTTMSARGSSFSASSRATSKATTEGNGNTSTTGNREAPKRKTTAAELLYQGTIEAELGALQGGGQQNSFLSISAITQKIESVTTKWNLANSILQCDGVQMRDAAQELMKVNQAMGENQTASGACSSDAESEFLASSSEAFYPLCFDLSREKAEFCTAFQISKCQSILCAFLAAFDRCNAKGERKDSFLRKKEPWELVNKPAHSGAGGSSSSANPMDLAGVVSAVSKKWRNKSFSPKKTKNKNGKTSSSSSLAVPDSDAKDDTATDREGDPPPLQGSLSAAALLVHQFQEKRRRSSSSSSASSLFEVRKDEDQEKFHASITPFYTHGEDIVRIALKVCKRALLDHDDTLDDPGSAEVRGSMLFDEWKYISRVNLDDPSQVLDRLQRPPKRGAPPFSASCYYDPLDIRTKELKRQEKLKKQRHEKDAGDDITYFATMPDFAKRPVCRFLAHEANSVLHEFHTSHSSRCLIGPANTWIIKPAGKSRGRGIEMCRELDEILSKTASGPLPSYLYSRTPDDGEELSNVGKYIEQWIVQKYIERPLTVKGYKFDIRQWVLVTDWNPLTVYVWKQPYIRFASNKYSTSDFSAYVHLVNNSIVAYDKDNFGSYNHELETEHYMWFYQKFQRFLHDSYCPHCVAAAKYGHSPAQPDFLHEPPFTCETFGVRWEDVKFVQEEVEEDEEDDLEETPQARSASRGPSSRTLVAGRRSRDVVGTSSCSRDGTSASTACASNAGPAPSISGPGGTTSTTSENSNAPANTLTAPALPKINIATTPRTARVTPVDKSVGIFNSTMQSMLPYSPRESRIIEEAGLKVEDVARESPIHIAQHHVEEGGGDLITSTSKAPALSSVSTTSQQDQDERETPNRAVLDSSCEGTTTDADGGTLGVLGGSSSSSSSSQHATGEPEPRVGGREHGSTTEDPTTTSSIDNSSSDNSSVPVQDTSLPSSSSSFSSSAPHPRPVTRDEDEAYQRSRRMPPPDPKYCVDTWSSKIVPEMSKIVKMSLLAVQDGIEHRKNSMELFGYDFMLDEDLKVWLIEVNSSPAMDYSTPVTTPLVKKVMEDLAKVVVDLPNSSPTTGTSSPEQDSASTTTSPPKRDTGEWELIYQGATGLRKPTFLGKLEVLGKQIAICTNNNGGGGGKKRKSSSTSS